MMQRNAPDCQTEIFTFLDLPNVDNACNVLTVQVFKLLTIKSGPTPHLQIKWLSYKLELNDNGSMPSFVRIFC